MKNTLLALALLGNNLAFGSMLTETALFNGWIGYNYVGDSDPGTLLKSDISAGIYASGLINSDLLIRGLAYRDTVFNANRIGYLNLRYNLPIEIIPTTLSIGRIRNNWTLWSPYHLLVPTKVTLIGIEGIYHSRFESDASSSDGVKLKSHISDFNVSLQYSANVPHDKKIFGFNATLQNVEANTSLGSIIKGDVEWSISPGYSLYGSYTRNTPSKDIDALAIMILLGAKREVGKWIASAEYQHFNYSSQLEIPGLMPSRLYEDVIVEDIALYLSYSTGKTKIYGILSGQKANAGFVNYGTMAFFKYAVENGINDTRDLSLINDKDQTTSITLGAFYSITDDIVIRGEYTYSKSSGFLRFLNVQPGSIRNETREYYGVSMVYVF